MTYPSDPNRPEFAFGARSRQSPFFDRARAAGACMYTLYNHMVVPVSYGNPTAEYDRLMNHASMWDVAAERQVQLKGPDAQKLAQMMSPRDVSKRKIGQGFYTPILNKAGGVINDPILLNLQDDLIWLSIADSDVRLYAMGLADAYDLDVEVTEPDASPLAVQGPKAEDVIAEVFGEHVRDIRYFWFIQTDVQGIPVVLQRSGWSKQGGFEIYLRDGSRGSDLWDIVWAAGEKVVGDKWGPGAPNAIERIESGLFSWGTDFDELNNPYECGLGKWCKLDGEHDFLAKDALLRIQNEGAREALVGLHLSGDEPLPGIVKPMPIIDQAGNAIGTVRASVWSPRLNKNIALARIASGESALGNKVQADVGAGFADATVVAVPFV